GSGKTTVLTDRVVALLRAGTPPERLAAITFTEKAAGELLARVRDKLEAAEAADPTPGGAAALAGFGRLTLSTIHSFCQGLLRSEALAADWAPDTLLGDALFTLPEVQRAWAGWRAGFDARHPELGLLLRMAVSADALRAAAGHALTFMDLAPVADPTPWDGAAVVAELAEVAHDLAATAAVCRAPDTCTLYQSNQTLLAAVAAAAGEGALGPHTAWLLTRTKGLASRKGGRAADWPGGGKPAFLDACATVAQWRARHLSRLHAVVVRDLAERFVPAVEQAKLDGAAVDFNDLLFRTARLLTGSPTARRRLAQGFDALLIDEVQDTDPIQAEVAALLTRAVEAEGGWDQVPPAPGRLFAVGDRKQSIYRWRRADVHTWDTLQALVAQGGERHTLTWNFRSVPGIVAWVNHSFTDMAGAEVPQVASRTPAGLDPVVYLPVDAQAEMDEAVARHLLDLHARQAPVVDRRTGQARPMRWGDVMVLLPGWGKADGLQTTLARAGIPALVEGGRTFFERDEIRLCVAALQALDESGDTAAAAFALRGLFGLGYHHLAAHKAAGGALRYTVGEQPPGPVTEALVVLRDLHRRRGRAPWVDLLDELLEACEAPAVWALLVDGPARLANLQKLRTVLRGLEAEARGPGAVIEALTVQAKASDDQDESRFEAGGDAVRIASYFGAKGLEAPIAVVVHAHRSHQGQGWALDRATRTVAFKVGDLAPPDWERLEAAERAEGEAERQRWMYVACTRPRDQLVLVAGDRTSTGKVRSTDLVTGWLAEGLPEPPPDHEALWSPTGRPDVAVRVRHFAQLPAPAWRDETFPGRDATVDDLLADPPVGEVDGAQAWIEADRAAVQRAKRACTRWRSVQQLVAARRVTAGTGIGAAGGTLVHAVMERLDLKADAAAQQAQAQALLAAEAALHGADAALQAAAGAVLQRLLMHPVLARARQAAEHWREVPFTFLRGRTQVSGTIDLCFPEDAARTRWVVVDWKSDSPPPGSPIREAYERQLALYARALLETVSPELHIDTCLVGPHAELPAVDAAEAALEDVAPALVAGLQRLLEAGVPAPQVGLDAGDGAVLELAWPERRLGLVLDPTDEDRSSLSAEGWTLVEADTAAPGWAGPALAALGVALEGAL
ncbi:MAG: UvrD-helicase domain-containing protein, partial [Myxococcales bacterium]|nr:UvrD-helicase domain-containing protein [Myxococcales bacterium]